MSDSLLQILINAKDNASAVIKSVGGSVDNLKKQTAGLAQQGLKQLNQGFEATANIIKTGVVVGVAGLTTALGVLGNSSVQAASDFQKQMIVLDLTATKYGLNSQKAKELAKTLGTELRIGTGDASEALQYLIKSGLTLDQSSDLLRRFTNEAITGKSSSIDLATAVKNLAFAYTTGNSALGNMSGVSENFSDIEEKGLAILQKKGELLGLSVGQLDSAQIMQARYAGMIELTNLTMGASEKLQGTYSDNLLIIQARFQELQLELGQRLLPLLSELGGALVVFLDQVDIKAVIDSVIISFNNLMAYLQPVFEFFKQNSLILQSILVGLAGVISALVVSALVSMAVSAVLAAAPFIVFGVIIGGLYYAFQSNFLGIRDITNEVFGWFVTDIMPKIINTFNYLKDVVLPLVVLKFQEFWAIVKPLLEEFGNFFGFILTSLLQAFVDFIAVTVVPLIIFWVQSLYEGVKIFIDLLVALWVVFGESVKTILNGIISTVSGFIILLVGVFTGNKTKVEDGFRLMLSGLVGIVEGIINAIGAGFVAGLKLIRNKIQEFIDSLPGEIGAGEFKVSIPKPRIPQIPDFSPIKFAGGGLVGGSSYTGDRIPALVNSGEMVLNKEQQTNLFKLANGEKQGASVTNNFYIQGESPEVIAQKVSEILAQQYNAI